MEQKNRSYLECISRYAQKSTLQEKRDLKVEKTEKTKYSKLMCLDHEDKVENELKKACLMIIF